MSSGNLFPPNALALVILPAKKCGHGAIFFPTFHSTQHFRQIESKLAIHLTVDEFAFSIHLNINWVNTYLSSLKDDL